MIFDFALIFAKGNMARKFCAFGLTCSVHEKYDDTRNCFSKPVGQLSSLTAAKWPFERIGPAPLRCNRVSHCFFLLYPPGNHFKSILLQRVTGLVTNYVFKISILCILLQKTMNFKTSVSCVCAHACVRACACMRASAPARGCAHMNTFIFLV